MKLASKDANSWQERQSFRWFRLRKRMRQRLKYASGCDKIVLYIVGCQRSGTSMISHLFRLDQDVITYDEVSPLSAGDMIEGLRLDPLPQVSARILADRAPLVVCKPLVESQNLKKLLDLFPRTGAIWMYRDFRDVAKSSLEYFGQETGQRDLAPILIGDQANWRAERLAPEVQDRIQDLYSPDLSPHDAAALYWYARNSLYFSEQYDLESRVRTCCYGDLVTHPGTVMSAAYAFLERPYPGDRIVEDVVSGSHGRGREIVLSPPVLDLCTEMLARLHNQRTLTVPEVS